jgi:dienelactone hydrolase
MKNATARLTVLAAASVAALTMSFAAQAATVGPADDTFYTFPGAPTGSHGDLISYRTTTVNLGTAAPANKAWNVLYQSTDSVGAANVVSGTVLVPTAAWSGTGARPVILYAVGTQGLAQRCAPSRQLAGGTEYETANINAALKAGYAVLVTDYAGYLTGGGNATYLAGASQGHAVLDIFKAAQGLSGAGVTATSKVGVWGYSQGGQSAAWAAELLSTYAPDVKVAGVAAGGIPANFRQAALALDGNVGASFLASGINGLVAQYPKQMPINLIANADGKAALAKLKTQCVFEALFDFQDKKISDYTIDNIPLSDLLAVDTIGAVIDAQNLGTNPINVPMYQFHGQADEFIPLDQDVALKNTYCTKYPNVQFDLYPSEHIVTLFQAATPALSWFADRFAGKAAPSTCSNTASAPASTALPGGGDLIVALNKWPLTAKIHLKTLNQDVILPATSTLTAEANVNKNTLTGALNVPDFKQSISIIGLKISTGIKVTPVGSVTGSTSLDTAGQLHIKGNAQTDITITSLLGIPFGECKTVTPVQFPIVFDGPVSSLGNGGLVFTGTTTFPQIKGCAISAILSALMSGSGQTYSFAVAPPAPVKF